MSDTSTGFSELPEDTMLLVNQLCNRFEAAWQSDQQPLSESFLDGLDPPTRLAALQELLPLEIAYRRLHNLPLDKAEFEARFSDLDRGWLGGLFDTAAEATPSERVEADTPAPQRLGDYDILDRLGAGGMGTVYKAVHRRMQRVVALKVLRPELSSKPHLLQRFEREVQAVARLSHPHIVAALDAREDDGVHYLITEYVDGRDLDHLVKEQGPVAVDAAVSMILQAARGLEYAHSKHVIHRDIKPANLLLSSEPDAKIKLLDLGLARFSSDDSANEPQATELTKTGMVMGTAAYMAPEQARNTKNADERSDIYSLGCTLHFLLTGRPTYGGETIVDTILAHANEPIPSLLLGDERSRIPAQIDRIFRKMVAKVPGERYQSMSEVIAVLESFANAVSIITTPQANRASKPRVRQRTLPSRRRMTTTVACALVALAVVVAVVYWQPDVSPQPFVPPGDHVLSFNGYSSYIEIPSLTLDPTQPVTLEAVVEMRTARTSNIMSCLGRDWMALFVGGRGNWGISRRVGDQSMLIQATEPARIGQSVHLAATWDGSNLHLFVDGERAETTTLAFELPETQGGTYIGGVRRDLLPSDQNDRFFDGIITTVRITAGIKYKASFPAPTQLNAETDTLALYVLDAGQGQLVQDKSPHGHDGEIIDGEWITR